MHAPVTTWRNPVRDYSGADSIAEVTGRDGTDMANDIEAALEVNYTDLVICLVGAVDERVRGNTPDWATTVVERD